MVVNDAGGKTDLCSEGLSGNETKEKTFKLNVIQPWLRTLRIKVAEARLVRWIFLWWYAMECSIALDALDVHVERGFSIVHVSPVQPKDDVEGTVD